MYLFCSWKQIGHCFLRLIGALCFHRSLLFLFSYFIKQTSIFTFLFFLFGNNCSKIFKYSQNKVNSMRSPQIHLPNWTIYLHFVTFGSPVSFYSFFFLKHFKTNPRHHVVSTHRLHFNMYFQNLWAWSYITIVLVPHRIKFVLILGTI